MLENGEWISIFPDRWWEETKHFWPNYYSWRSIFFKQRDLGFSSSMIIRYLVSRLFLNWSSNIWIRDALCIRDIRLQWSLISRYLDSEVYFSVRFKHFSFKNYWFGFFFCNYHQIKYPKSSLLQRSSTIWTRDPLLQWS